MDRPGGGRRLLGTVTGLKARQAVAHPGAVLCVPCEDDLVGSSPNGHLGSGWLCPPLMPGRQPNASTSVPQLPQSFRTCPAKKDMGVYPRRPSSVEESGEVADAVPLAWNQAHWPRCSRVMSPASVNFQVVAHGGLGQADGFGQVAGAAFAQPTGSGQQLQAGGSATALRSWPGSLRRRGRWGM